MTIVLLILKIIGIILLVILSLFLLLVLLVLFVPVRYRVSGSWHNNQANVKVRVSWLLYLFIFALDQTPEKSGSYLRIFGIRKKAKKADNRDSFAENIEQEPSESGTGKETGKKPESGAETGKEPRRGAETEQEPESGTETGKASPAERSPGEKKANIFTKISDKIRDIRQKIRDILQRIKKAVRQIDETIAKIRTILEDEHFRPAVGFLGGKAGWFLRKVCPKKFRLKLQFSTGSPDTTGEVLGVIAMFPQAYRNRWDITPDFMAEKAYAEADFDVRGRAFLFHVAGMLISVLKNKDCRGLYKTIKNIF